MSLPTLGRLGKGSVDLSKNDGELDSSFFSIGGFKTKKGKGTISRPREGAEMQLLNIQVGGRTNDSSAFLFADGTQTPGLKVSIDDSMLTDFSGKKGAVSVRSVFPQTLKAKPSYLNAISSGKSDNLEKVLR